MSACPFEAGGTARAGTRQELRAEQCILPLPQLGGCPGAFCGQRELGVGVVRGPEGMLLPCTSVWCL